MQVIKTSEFREGTLILKPNPRTLILGTRKPTEHESIVMAGFAKAHPWFKDPLRMGAEAWQIIEQTAKDQGYDLRVRVRGAKS